MIWLKAYSKRFYSQVLAYISKLSPDAAAALLSKAKPVKVEEEVVVDVDGAEAAAEVMRALAAGHGV